MDKPTHKIENGIRVELTEEECNCIMKEWKENAEKALKEEEARKLEEARLQGIRESISKMTNIPVEDLKKAFSN